MVRAEISVLADGVARPAAGVFHGGTTDQAHGAVHHDGVDLVAFHHADVEEAGIFAVHGGVQRAPVAVAVILRCLHQADLGIGESRHQMLEPILVDRVVGVDDADDLGVGGGAGERDAQGAGLESPATFCGVEELEARAEQLRQCSLIGSPERGIRRVVDDHHALEVRIVEAGDRIEGRLEHFRRLEIGRDVDRHLGGVTYRGDERREQAARPAAEYDRGDLLDARHGDGGQRQQKKKPEAERECGADDEVVAVPIVEYDRRPSPGPVGRGGEHGRLHEGGSGDEQDRQGNQETDPDRDGGELEVVGFGDDARPGELGGAIGVEQAPIGADAAFERLPGLVEGFDDIVVDPEFLRPGHELAQHHGLLHPAGLGGMAVVAGARPAEFGDDDALARMHLPQGVIMAHGLVEHVGRPDALPVRQNVGGDEVHVRGELG